MALEYISMELLSTAKPIIRSELMRAIKYSKLIWLRSLSLKNMIDSSPVYQIKL